jgi:hypothetical protein
VTDPDRVKFLFGPYTAPALKRGDRATCLYRDTTVIIITRWSDAPIPSPRCRVLDARSGGNGLLVDEELARAIRHESAQAVMFWWGASHNAVCCWRKALGVRGIASEGTHRLARAVGKENGDALRGKCLPPEQVERRRRTALEQNLAQHLVTGCHGPRWTPEDIALLGILPDEEVAARTGRTTGAVRQKREELSIPNPAGNRWRPEDVALLGTLPDTEVARRLGRSLQSVTQKRIKLGIPNPFDGRKRIRS